METPSIHPRSAVLRRSASAARRGITSVIAMLYLTIFSMLAIGFYSSVTTQVQVSYNDMNINAAQAAAESGMQFIRYQLSALNVAHNTPSDQLFNQVYIQLATAMNATGNLGTDTVGLSGSSINIPATTGHMINLDNAGAGFFASITQSGQVLVVKVTGQARSGQIQRAIQMNYGIAQRASSIFNYGVASRGSINMNGNTKILGASDPTKGSVLAATMLPVTALTMNGNQQISGDASFVNPNAVTSFAGNSSIAGYTPASGNFAAHIHKGVDNPTFPQVDTSAFLPYCTNTYSSGKTLVNCILPPGNWSFAGNITIQGILYIQTPSIVSFTGNTTIQGCIVVENNPKGTPATNKLSFTGNVSASGIETLPVSTTFPAGEVALKNAFLLAPNFTTSFTGNFGTIGGSIIADSLSYTGNAGGTVNGSVIGLGDTQMSMNGNADIIINSSGTAQYPSGVFFGNQYVPLPDTYQEVAP
jgi:Tfp pilus assembly protein PilX